MTITLCTMTLALSKLVNSLGLILDVCGAVLIFKFGLPPDVRRSGASYLMTEQADESEIKKGKRYDRVAYIGAGLLIAGFVSQLLSNLL